ncbi:MAG: hypothetical protein FJX45_04690 [Alphaproteobacteria bacterium]|nr:hypothetical protein [Alphaproteobacteria bacterium]MBM3654042.1 hypothetical protein [Alphaproteobacteria bacterium]
MIKLALTTALAAVAFSASAYAGQWNVTEANKAGIKRAQGTWSVATEGDKVSGKGELQLDNGTVLTYKLDGEFAGGVYKVKLVDRSDSKKNCVWTGKPVEGAHNVYNGEAACDGEIIVIRGGQN